MLRFVIILTVVAVACSSGDRGQVGGDDTGGDTGGDTGRADSVSLDEGADRLGVEDVWDPLDIAHLPEIGDTQSDLLTGDGASEVEDTGGSEVKGVTVQESDVLTRIFPGASQFVAALFDSRRYFKAWDQSELLGAAFVGARYGFNSEVVSVTGFDLLGMTQSLEILSQWESWWFRVESSPGFLQQFSGLDVSKMDPDTRDTGPYVIDAVSGATISSEAVIGGFWESVRQYKKWREME